MAYKGAILEPKITLESVDGDDIIMNASPEWKQKLVDFLKYAATTDDAEVDCIVPSFALDEVRSEVSRQMQRGDCLVLSRNYFSKISLAFIALGNFPGCAMYDYSPDDFDRLHDDFLNISNSDSSKSPYRSLRIKTGLKGEFDG